MCAPCAELVTYLPEVFPVRVPTLPIVLFFALTIPATAPGQFREGDPGGIKLGESRVQQWKAGVVVQAAAPCRGLVGYVPIPIDWPEQQVRIVDEEVSPSARVRYQTIDGGVKVMIVSIPYLPTGEEAKAIVTLEIQRSTILPPDDTDQYVLPDLKKLDAQVRMYLAPSPLIESTDLRIRALAKEIPAEAETAWEKVEAIYDWVREEVEYKKGPIKGAKAALRDKTGDCEELTSLFIAICRAADIPARTVWVEGHCYPEFYLEDAEGKGHWFPCQAAGSRAFGGIPEYRAILQKGDNFRPPYNQRQRQRYLAEHLTGTGGKPRVRFVREMATE